MKKFPHNHRHGSGKKGDTARLAGLLAPLEEQDGQAKNQKSATPALDGGAHRENGAIVVDSKDVSFPADMAERPREGGLFGIEPVVLVILILMLAFIAFIAWRISQMPVQS